MKKLAMFMLCVACAFAPITHVNALTVHSAIDQSTGDGVATWDFFDGTEFVIQASILTGGVWGTAATISNPTITSIEPRVATNASGEIAVIWQGEDPIAGLTNLYGATYNTGLAAWDSPQLISAVNESILQNTYHVLLSTAGEVSVTYAAFQLSTFDNAVRAIFCPTYGTWTSPVTLAP